jgi:SAM-dependent methyltransferase
MVKSSLHTCSICSSTDIANILDLACGILDGSTLYENAVIDTCNHCGHIFNRLTATEFQGLIKYYNEEYAPTNMGAADDVGDRPGSKNQFTVSRYEQLYKQLKPYITETDFILDVGCAMGGFLDYLHGQGYRKLSGIDVTEKYVEHANSSGKYAVKKGSAEFIPFEDNQFDVLLTDQVMEHLAEPINAFKEAKRVLKQGGLFCIGVPDAAKYDDFYFFDFYWFIMREHIQHFDIDHLALMAEREGFELVSFSNSETPMMSHDMILPNLHAIFRLTGVVPDFANNKDRFTLQNSMRKYVKNEFTRLNQKLQVIEQIKAMQKEIYVWGIGREFLYLYEQAGLKNCNIAGLIDSNPYKQTHVTIGGQGIVDSTVLKNAAADSILLITAVAHGASIKKVLANFGYQGQVVEF